MTAIIKLEEVENKIIVLRKQKVILDSDVAEIYGVHTRDINKAVSNNPDKFPAGYIFEITKDEKSELVENFHHLSKIKFSSQLPKALTEKGLYMLATILKGTKATQTTIAIVETFARIKNLTRNIKEISEAKNEKSKQNLMQRSGEIISEILGDDLSLSETETSFELNFAVLKLKHTVKKKKDK